MLHIMTYDFIYEFIYEFMYMKNIVKSYPNSRVPRLQIIPGEFVLEMTHPLYKVKELSALLVTFGSNNLLR